MCDSRDSYLLPLKATHMSKRAYLSGTHGGLECGETMIEGTENGDHVIGDGLALVKWFLYERRSLSESVHRFRYLHFQINLISLFRWWNWKRKRKRKCTLDLKFVTPFSFSPTCVSFLLFSLCFRAPRETVEGTVGPHFVLM